MLHSELSRHLGKYGSSGDWVYDTVASVWFISPLEWEKAERAGSTTLLPVCDLSVLWSGKRRKGLGLRHRWQCVIHQSFGVGKGGKGWVYDTVASV